MPQQQESSGGGTIHYFTTTISNNTNETSLETRPTPTRACLHPTRHVKVEDNMICNDLV